MTEIAVVLMGLAFVFIFLVLVIPFLEELVFHYWDWVHERFEQRRWRRAKREKP